MSIHSNWKRIRVAGEPWACRYHLILDDGNILAVFREDHIYHASLKKYTTVLEAQDTPTAKFIAEIWSTTI